MDRDAQEAGFDWSGAKLSEAEGEEKAGGDGGALVVSRSMAVYLRMDDCFMTPQGLLMFDVPRAYFGPREALEQQLRRVHR